MTLKEFAEKHQRHVFEKSKAKAQGMRYGQWLFNELHEHNKGLANAIHDTENDPFYDDSRIPQFWCSLILIWE